VLVSDFSQVVSEALAKIAAEGETQLSSLSAITAQLGDGSPDIELDVEEAEILVETLDKVQFTPKISRQSLKSPISSSCGRSGRTRQCGIVVSVSCLKSVAQMSCSRDRTLYPTL